MPNQLTNTTGGSWLNAGLSLVAGAHRLAQELPRREWHRSRWAWSAIACVLLIASTLCVCVAGGWYRDWQVRSELQSLADAGQPTDLVTLHTWYEQRAHREGTDAWAVALQMSEGCAIGIDKRERVPFLGEAELPSLLQSDANWEHEAETVEFLNDIQPLLKQVELAAQFPAPVWQPIGISSDSLGYETASAARSIMRVVQLELSYALHKRDAIRAERALHLLKATSDAFDWNSLVVHELIHIAIRRSQLDAVARSLAYDIWSDQQLAEIKLQVETTTGSMERLRNAVVGERAYSLHKIQALDRFNQRGSHLLSRLFGGELSMLHAYRSYLEVADWNLRPSHFNEITLREHNARALSVARMSAVPFHVAMDVQPIEMATLARSLLEEDVQRQIVQCAFHIKLYQRQHQRWPTTPNEVWSLTQFANKLDELPDWKFLSLQPLTDESGVELKFVGADGRTTWGSPFKSVIVR
ncbi:MAG: hypothetical protein KF752_06375 [Pirellulaceae bacterium]|nr:hypothetical protein [Pirellulaceae bacterium]